MANPVDNVPLSIYRYSQYSHNFTVVDNNEAVVDLTNYHAIMEIRSAPQGAVLYTATTDDDLSVTGASGLVALTIPGATIASWAFTDAQYDLYVLSPASSPRAIARGRVRVYVNITDPLPLDIYT